MSDLPGLQALLHHAYGLATATLTPLHLFPQPGRGVYRVDAPGQGSFVLRAYQQPLTAVAWLADSAAVLRFLEAADFPAPRVRRTNDGGLLGHHQGWSALLLTYIAGEMTSGALADFAQLGSLVARLHTLALAPAVPRSPLPFCRWQPQQKITDWLTQLQAVAPTVPTELHGLYTFSVEILSQLLQWPAMPTALLHADPNSFNTVRTVSNGVVLIDWDTAGIGPAILDLGYLLLTAHAVLPAWPQIEANAALITAIMQGYGAVRPLTQQEQQALPIAVCLNDAVWAAQAMPQVVGRAWRENRTLTRFGARYPSLKRIGQIAQSRL
ncbi:MAG: phosphotransferase [Caldilineaceae bacterium]